MVTVLRFALDFDHDFDICRRIILRFDTQGRITQMRLTRLRGLSNFLYKRVAPGLLIWVASGPLDLICVISAFTTHGPPSLIRSQKAAAATAVCDGPILLAHVSARSPVPATCASHLNHEELHTPIALPALL